MISFLDQLNAYHQTAGFSTPANHPDAVAEARSEFLRARLADPKRFTCRDVETVLEISSSAASRFLARQQKRGVIELLRPGKRGGNPNSRDCSLWGFVK